MNNRVATHPGKREKTGNLIKGVPRQEMSRKTQKIEKNLGKILELVAEVELNFSYLPYTSIVLSHKSLSPNNNRNFKNIFGARNKGQHDLCQFHHGIVGNFSLAYIIENLGKILEKPWRNP